MPPPAFFGTSATMASVVISSAATEAAFWIATRLGRVDDALGDQLPYSPVCESKPYEYPITGSMCQGDDVG